MHLLKMDDASPDLQYNINCLLPFLDFYRMPTDFCHLEFEVTEVVENTETIFNTILLHAATL